MTGAFYIAAVIAVVSTLMVVTRRNVVHALLYLILSLLAIAVVFYSLGAPYVAALEVIVYAGAIMVLFVFTVMMLNVRGMEKETRGWLSARAWIGPGILAAVLLAELVAAARGFSDQSVLRNVVGPKEVGARLFGPYLLGVELASMLLLAGLVGAYHLGRKAEPGERSKEKTEERHDIARR